MKRILSIQSHVAYGYVGNRAAVFPLQRLGFDVIAINTVQFSNHTGYGDWEGDAVSPEHILRLMEGLKRRGVLEQVDGLLTGYMGTPEIAETILGIANQLPSSALWLCDPVMGDVGRGFFARPGIPEFFKDKAIAKARIITPNQFELEYLSGHTVENLDDALIACDKMHEAGCEIVLLTSLIHKETKDSDIQMLASHKNGERYLVTTPRLPLDPAPNGAGDCTAALFLAHNINGESLDKALEKTAASIYALFEETMKAKSRELTIVQAQDRFINAPDVPVLKIESMRASGSPHKAGMTGRVN